MKANYAFRGYAMSYKVELVEKEDPIRQLETSKLNIKDLFSDLLNETEGFKYQVTLKVMLKRMQSKWRNWISFSLFQLDNKNNDKS